MSAKSPLRPVPTALVELLSQLPYRWDVGHRTTLNVPETVLARAEQISMALQLKSTNKALLALLQLGLQQLETMVTLQARVEDRWLAWQDSQRSVLESGEDLDPDQVDEMWERALTRSEAAVRA